MNSLVFAILNHCRLASISWHSNEATDNSDTFGAFWNFEHINQIYLPDMFSDAVKWL
jgi:hypothetical protein